MAGALRSALPVTLCLLAAGCRTLGRDSGEALATSTPPAAVVEAFVEASLSHHFRRSHALLAAPLRQRYTPATLERDFFAAPGVQARLERAREASGLPPRKTPDGVEFPLEGVGAVRLVAEAGSFRVVALE